MAIHAYVHVEGWQKAWLHHGTQVSSLERRETRLEVVDSPVKEINPHDTPTQKRTHLIQPLTQPHPPNALLGL